MNCPYKIFRLLMQEDAFPEKKGTVHALVPRLGQSPIFYSSFQM